MEPDSVNLEQAILGLAIMSAIPVVVLELWIDYFVRRIERPASDDPEAEKALDLEKVKVASLCALISQILLFLGASDLREHYPVLSPLIFVVAVSFQIFIQSRAENMLNERLSSNSGNRENILGISVRATLCWVLGVMIHVFCLGLAAGITAGLIQYFRPSFVAGILALAVAGVLALVTGITLNLALAPFYFKHIFPMRTLEEGQIRARIESCFLRFGLIPPELWVLQLAELRVTQNIWVGLRGRTGALRPCFFLSNLVLATLSIEELEVLTLNQISHFILKHPKKRGILILTLISATTLLALVSILVGQGFGTEEPVLEIVGTIVSLLVFLGTFRILFLQTQRHEMEADIYTVKNMGVSCEVLGSALRKLDILADPIPLDLGSISKDPVGFPETEQRIKRFKDFTSNQDFDKAA